MPQLFLIISWQFLSLKSSVDLFEDEENRITGVLWVFQTLHAFFYFVDFVFIAQTKLFKLFLWSSDRFNFRFADIKISEKKEMITWCMGISSCLSDSVWLHLDFCIFFSEKAQCLVLQHFVSCLFFCLFVEIFRNVCKTK